MLVVAMLAPVSMEVPMVSVVLHFIWRVRTAIVAQSGGRWWAAVMVMPRSVRGKQATEATLVLAVAVAVTVTMAVAVAEAARTRTRTRTLLVMMLLLLLVEHPVGHLGALGKERARRAALEVGVVAAVHLVCGDAPGCTERHGTQATLVSTMAVLSRHAPVPVPRPTPVSTGMGAIVRRRLTAVLLKSIAAVRCWPVVMCSLVDEEKRWRPAMMKAGGRGVALQSARWRW